MPRESFEIKNRVTGTVQVTAEIECDANASYAVKLGLAVRWAWKSGADLSGADLSGADLSRADLSRADLSGAYLSGANLSGAYLSGANFSGAYLSGANLSRADLSRADLIDGGQRSDGYRFVGHIRDGALWIKAGCRYFPLADAREHWRKTRGGTPLGEETGVILDHIERVAAIRKLVV